MPYTVQPANKVRVSLNDPRLTCSERRYFEALAHSSNQLHGSHYLKAMSVG